MPSLHFVVCLLLLSLCAAVVGQDIAYFSIRVHDTPTNTMTDQVVGFNVSSPMVDVDVHAYCEEHKIQQSFCSLLYENVLKHATKSTRSSVVSLPNSHLPRHPAALAAEHERLFTLNSNSDFSSIREAEEHAVHAVLQTWNRAAVDSVVVIHSCTLLGSQNAVLNEIMQQLAFYDVFAAVHQILVFNYGEAVAVTVPEAWSEKVLIVQVHRPTVYFEVPTLRILQQLSRHMVEYAAGDATRPPRVLYLHTKGVSYQQQHIQIEDWVDLMLYSLAGRHHTCAHLLLSGEVDCVGTNYKSHPRRIFSGNFWWSTAAHLAALPELRHEESGKYEAETWVLSRPGTRIFVMHGSNVNHAEHAYPALCYARPEHHVAPYALSAQRLHARELAGNKASSYAELPLQRVDALCGGTTTVREARRFWELL
jgi:hypothetical protein